MNTIELIPCDYICFSNECYKFFINNEYEKFIVAYITTYYDEKENVFKKCGDIKYGLLEKFTDSMKNTCCIMNGQFLYNYGKKCKIIGYCGINIEKKNNNE